MRIIDTGRSATAPHPMRRAGDAATILRATDSAGLVPVSPPRRTAPVSSSLSRPDAAFITHLLATADQSPQTRTLRRAAIVDVETAYRTVIERNALTPNSIVRRIA